MYKPAKKFLEKYSSVLVNFALGGGKGIKKKEVVYLQLDIAALPLALEVYKRILENEAYPILQISDEEFTKIFFALAKDHQLEFFPKKYHKSLIDTFDHRIYLYGDKDPFYLKYVDPKKIIKVNKKQTLIRKWMEKKEDAGKLTWTIALYGTNGLAKEAKLSEKAYWEVIEKACFLNHKNPVSKWREVSQTINNLQKKLTELKIHKLHITAKNTDLWITIGEKRRWMGGGGRNIPSFEIFTSPDWRGTRGKIYFDFPLYRYGNIIKNIYLEFEKGKVRKAKAEKNEKLLIQLIKQKNANKIGEFSLTDKRFSKIDKFMATTLFDENFGGEWGNTHLALGTSYNEAYDGDVNMLSEIDLEDIGFNKSPEHTDIIMKQNRVVEAIWKNGKRKIIYKDGEFCV